MNINELSEKIKDLRQKKGADLSMEEDLSIAIMNLISLEEHFFFTAEKTGNNKYLTYLEQSRELRKKLLAKMMPKNEGESWCISKHLLAATMRLMEVGTKYQSLKDLKKAEEAFDDAYKIYNMFWAIRLDLLKMEDLKEIKETDEEKEWSVEDIVDKLVDCCRE